VVLNYLPLMAERFARQRLQALAKVECKHDAGVPVVLFLCTHNAGRSQMALGFFTHLAGDACPVFPGRRYEDWVLEDPAGRDLEDVRPIRDEIERSVRRLLDQIEVPARA
jgi:protein-tyrosine-phosphatase